MHKYRHFSIAYYEHVNIKSIFPECYQKLNDLLKQFNEKSSKVYHNSENIDMFLNLFH